MDRQDHHHAPVSVIIPAYNSAATIGRALTSIAAQTSHPLEVIVVDDGSQDQTYDVAVKMQGMLGDTTLIVLRQPNRGAGAARNAALRVARGEYIAFLDADDEWLPEKLSRSLSRLFEKKLTLVTHNGWAIDGERRSLLDIASRFRASRQDCLHGLYRWGFIATSSVVVSAAAVRSAGGFDETLLTGQDFDLWLRMLFEPAANFEVFDECLFLYHVSKQGITSNTSRRLANTLEIAERHVPALRQRTGRWVMSFCFRIFVVHAEAIYVFSRNRKWLSVIRSFLSLPRNLVVLTMRAR